MGLWTWQSLHLLIMSRASRCMVGNSIRIAKLALQRTVVLSACCKTQRGFLGVRILPEEVRCTEAMDVRMNADIGYHLEVRISALCAVSVEHPYVLGGVFPCL